MQTLPIQSHSTQSPFRDATIRETADRESTIRESTIRDKGLLSPANALRIIAVGDSTIYGYGDPEGGGWVERLRRRWMMPSSLGHAIYNLGIRGDRVQQVSQRLKSEFCNRGELRHRYPDGILLSVGINDSARLGRLDGRNFTAMEHFPFEVSALLDQAKHLSHVFFIGMTPVDEAKMPFSNCLFYNHADQRQYATLVQQACEARNIPYLNIFELWMSRGEDWWRSRLCEDGLHPNSLGYIALLDDIINWEPFATWTSAEAVSHF
jgi:lysophospholipase L1-like esterase